MFSIDLYLTQRTTFVLQASLLVALCIGGSGVANANSLAPVISLLLDDQEGCAPIEIDVGSSQLHHLIPACRSVGRQLNQGISAFARYFNFSHAGGPLHVDAIGAYPQPYDVYVYLKEQPPQGAAPGSGAEIDADNNSHEDFKSAQLSLDTLAAGEYQLEVTSTLDNILGRFNLSIYGDRVTAHATGSLGDTAITLSSASSGANAEDVECDTFDTAGTQDCSMGPDRASTISSPSALNDMDGDAARSYLKIKPDGAPFTDDVNPDNYACLKDNLTGLMWERKRGTGLHSVYDEFTWFNPDSNTNGGRVGAPDSTSICEGYLSGDESTFCNTKAFVDRVNSAGLCGYNDWRLPNRVELRSLVNLSRSPAIDPLFGDTVTAISDFYWTSVPSTYQSGSQESDHQIHVINFRNGDEPRGDEQNRSFQRHHIRLVRG